MIASQHDDPVRYGSVPALTQTADWTAVQPQDPHERETAY